MLAALSNGSELKSSLRQLETRLDEFEQQGEKVANDLRDLARHILALDLERQLGQLEQIRQQLTLVHCTQKVHRKEDRDAAEQRWQDLLHELANKASHEEVQQLCQLNTEGCQQVVDERIELFTKSTDLGAAFVRIQDQISRVAECLKLKADNSQVSGQFCELRRTLEGQLEQQAWLCREDLAREIATRAPQAQVDERFAALREELTDSQRRKSDGDLLLERRLQTIEESLTSQRLTSKGDRRDIEQRLEALVTELAPKVALEDVACRLQTSDAMRERSDKVLASAVVDGNEMARSVEDLRTEIDRVAKQLPAKAATGEVERQLHDLHGALMQQVSLKASTIELQSCSSVLRQELAAAAEHEEACRGEINDRLRLLQYLHKELTEELRQRGEAADVRINETERTFDEKLQDKVAFVLAAQRPRKKPPASPSQPYAITPRRARLSVLGASA